MHHWFFSMPFTQKVSTKLWRYFQYRNYLQPLGTGTMNIYTDGYSYFIQRAYRQQNLVTRQHKPLIWTIVQWAAVQLTLIKEIPSMHCHSTHLIRVPLVLDTCRSECWRPTNNGDQFSSQRRPRWPKYSKTSASCPTSYPF